MKRRPDRRALRYKLTPMKRSKRLSGARAADRRRAAKPAARMTVKKFKLGEEPDELPGASMTPVERIHGVFAASMFAWSLANGGRKPVFQMVGRLCHGGPAE
jgi:hypothetical protein